MHSKVLLAPDLSNIAVSQPRRGGYPPGMLTITPAANAALASLLDSPDVPDGAGIRISRGTGPDGEPAIGMMVVSEPESSDQVVETAGGVGIYVAPDTAETLDDKELDIEQDGERIAFSIHPQARNGGPPTVGGEPA
jgi:Fe-S cluster assembly iron-binding protein IscA